MSPRPNVSDARKEQIIQAAINVFSRLGFHEARMDDIVDEIGLSKGALYWYFKSKEEIIIAISDRIFNAEFRRMETLGDSHMPACQYLRSYLDMFMADLQGMQRVMPVIYEFYALAFRNKTVRTVMQRYLNSFISIIEPIVQRGMDQGEIASCDARRVALALGAQIEGTLLLWAYDPDVMNLEEQLRTGTNMLISSLSLTHAPDASGKEDE